jgi:hypothetical protein
VALGKYTWDHTAVGLVELYRRLGRQDTLPVPGGAVPLVPADIAPTSRAIREGAAPRGGDEA